MCKLYWKEINNIKLQKTLYPTLNQYILFINKKVTQQYQIKLPLHKKKKNPKGCFIIKKYHQRKVLTIIVCNPGY